MNTRPQPKTEVAIRWIMKETKFICMNASPDALSDLAEFGQVVGNEHEPWLIVDARYDFDEVVDYIKNYGTPDN